MRIVTECATRRNVSNVQIMAIASMAAFATRSKTFAKDATLIRIAQTAKSARIRKCAWTVHRTTIVTRAKRANGVNVSPAPLIPIVATDDVTTTSALSVGITDIAVNISNAVKTSSVTKLYNSTIVHNF